ncbi:hypothetical protein ZYGR_0U00620 [Zygosaccharomyces rouxii]|uniref:ZYRO0F10120p n=2 Tax=Zygosaccharomyces rouxii TaxID=4956 RepID=C5DY43_ZYGRC|nr:uncharacterized protein ZYRO0F10120g [Zygosaccharomyces rouxii]KAH9199462.1 hypothetical protein LQ764DRAFT_225692 [Zygosaccharomyces rouxii]GAV50206.1 hypothetical protein ZYGR_0U00620 [Zygosaccharomyces rouxii]CAR28704.1 ZYRO0F10120p [Zygosaccharomyces rouxii]
MVEWVVIAFDKADRSAYRSEHLAGIPPQVESGKLVCAGAIYNEPKAPGEPRTFAGSHLQVVADTKEEAIEIVKSDIFAKEGVWDLDNLIVYQFGCAIRQPVNKLK